jgi:hypothetical protein
MYKPKRPEVAAAALCEPVGWIISCTLKIVFPNGIPRASALSGNEAAEDRAFFQLA